MPDADAGIANCKTGGIMPPVLPLAIPAPTGMGIDAPGIGISFY